MAGEGETKSKELGENTGFSTDTYYKTPAISKSLRDEK